MERKGSRWSKGKAKRNKSIYMLTVSDRLLGLVKAFLYMCAAVYIFYRNIFGMIPAAVLGIYIFKLDQKKRIQEKKNDVIDQFKNMLSAMQGALEAGCSMERAILLSRNELLEIYGESAQLVNELNQLEKRLKLNRPLSEALKEMADNLEQPVIYEFIEIICITLMTGGNTVQIVKDTGKRIVENIELDAELEVMVAGKKLEQQIMTYMPAGIVLFLGMTGGDFLAPLYGNMVGGILMTVVLMGNILADYLGKRIVDVK